MSALIVRSRIFFFFALAYFLVSLSGNFCLAQAPAVATGDSRTVTEPVIPPTCQKLLASFHDVNEDVPASVESGNTSLDVTRLQAALNACQGSNKGVELSMDASGNNAFLTGPISIPTGVILVIDPGVTLYFTRNAQDYDTNPGTHTCGTVSGASNTASCKNLITIKNANNSGIMGYGKINARGGDVVLNSFATPGYQGSTAGKNWWDIANDATTYNGSQQNPRGIQVTSSNNVTLYKFTFKNPPNFHIAINTANGLTVWGIHIVTPYSAHNTDGIDPGNATNVTIRDTWISDGDDNVAVGAPSTLSSNMSIIHNHFFAGHGESIGSYTTGGVSNILFDDNLGYGDADVDGSNSTGIRIKSANDRGNLVTNIQYSNSCFANHGTQIQFTPIYNSNAGTLTPNFKNILLQNLRFSNQGAVATGSVTFLGSNNNGTILPITATLDNVTFDTLASNNLIAPSNAQIKLGPGQVSSNLANLLLGYNGVNGNVITDTRSGSLAAPSCNFTFLAPDLTGPQGLNQTVTAGQFPTAVVLLIPAIAATKYPYPTGTVTVTDEASRTFTATLPGTGDTIFVPITNAPAGTHTYTASYGGDSVYPAIASFGSYTVTVNSGTLPATTTALSGVPGNTTFGTAFTATATVSSTAAASGSLSFLVNGAVYATVPLASGAASYTFNLPIGSYSISALYAGDSANSGSASSASSLAVGGALTTTTLGTSGTSTTVGVPVSLTATVSSSAGIPTGTVTFNYTNATVTTPTKIGTATLTNGVASYSALLPQGVDSIVASYAATGNFGGSSSTNNITVTVSAAPPVPASTAPIALPYTMTTIVGGGGSTANTTCTGHADAFGDGCLGTAVQITGTGTGADLRSVTADPFGNVYFTDANAALVRKVGANGIVNNFAGYVSGTACVPTATVGCTPTLVKLTGKPRGVYSDPFGNIFIAGYGDNKVHVVRASDGKMYLVAGTGSGPTNTTDSAGDGGPAPSALLKGPRAIATDTAGNIYIVDSGDNRVREVLNPASGLPGAGNIQTVVGTGALSSTGDGGLATAATLNNPQGVAIDTSGNIYVGEGSKVRAVCVACTPGSGLAALLAKVGVPSAVNGNIYTVAGTNSSSNPTLAGGLGNTVSMGPQKIAIDANGNLYIADASNNVVWFEDGRTGYTRVIAGGGTASSCAASAIGDSCVGTQGIVGSNGGNGMGVGLDIQGNLYISDSTNIRIRKVSNNLRFGSTTLTTAVPQTLKIHFLPGDTPVAPQISSPDFTLDSGSCVLNATDTTRDCTYTATFKPAVAGFRSTPLSITTSLGNPGVLSLSGIGQGAGATLDPAKQFSFGQNLSPNAIATDNSGNVYVADGASRNVLKYAPGANGIGAGPAAASALVQSFMNPSALAVDSLGNVFIADSSTGLISQVSQTGTTKTLSTVFANPDGLAVDALNNLYVADATAKTITEIGSNLIATKTLVSTGLSAPAAVAVDPNANVLVADSTGVVYRYNAQTLARSTVTSLAAAPKALAVDAAGNVMVADAASNQIFAVPALSTSTPFVVASGIPGNSVALDSTGNIYTASTTNQVLQLLRTQATATYNGTGAAPSTVALLSTGNVNASLAVSNPDTTNFGLSVTNSTNCTGSLTSLTVVSGGACQFTSRFTPSSYNNFTNTATLSGNAGNASLATPAALQIVQIGNNAPFPVTVTIGAFTPVSPGVGDTIGLTATVASDNGDPAGTVTFSVDGSPLPPATVSGGTAAANISGLGAGDHTVTAVFTSSDPAFAGATATPVALTVLPLAATPVFSPQPGIYNVAQVVTLTDATPGATIYYTTDGSTPTTSSTLYIGAFTVSSTKNVKAIATAANYAPSSVGSGVYTITPAPPGGAPLLVVTSTLTKLLDGTYQARVTVTNRGTASVQGVTLTSAKLGGVSGTPTPMALGSIPVGGADVVTITFPGTAGASGAASVVQVLGTYPGTTFGGGLRVTLP